MRITEAQFKRSLQEDVRRGWLTNSGKNDLLRQMRLFDSKRAIIQTSCNGQVAGFVAGQLLVAPDVPDLLEKAQNRFPGRKLYFEPVGIPFGLPDRL